MILTKLRWTPATSPPHPATGAAPAVRPDTTGAFRDANDSHRAGGGKSGAVPLAALAPGQVARLIGVDAGRRLQRRLLALGLTPGTPLRLVSNVGGPVIVAVRTTRLALGREIARRVWVVPEADGS